MDTFVHIPILEFLARTTRNIEATLRLFGQQKQNKSYFISAGVGVSQYPGDAFHADFYIYAICVAGTAHLSLNGTRLSIKRNDFFAAIPSTTVQVHGHSPDFKAKVLVFERAFLLKNILDARQLEYLGYFNYDTLAHVGLTKAEAALLNEKLDTIDAKSTTTGVFHDPIMQSLIINLLFETAEVYIRYRASVAKKAVSREEELFMNFMDLVGKHFRSQQKLAYYADQLTITTKYLIQVCKAVSGKTPGALLDEALLAEAKLLLANPANNISMVSQALRYSDVAAFSKFFRKHTGVSPSAYKKG